MSAADELRKMHEAATPGPWKIYDDSNQTVKRIEVVAIGKTIAHIYRSVPAVDLPNAELFTYLRNHAADFVALIEAAEGLFAGEGQITIGEFESLKNALKPFTKE